MFFIYCSGGGVKSARYGAIKPVFSRNRVRRRPGRPAGPNPPEFSHVHTKERSFPKSQRNSTRLSGRPDGMMGMQAPPRAEPFRRFGAPSKKTLLTVFAKLGEVTVPCLGATLDRFPGKKPDTILRTVRRLLWQIVHGRTLQRVAMPFQIVRGRPRLAALSARIAPLDVMARHAEYGGDLGRRSCAWSAKTTPPWPVSIDHT